MDDATITGLLGKMADLHRRHADALDDLVADMTRAHDTAPVPPATALTHVAALVPGDYVQRWSGGCPHFAKVRDRIAVESGTVIVWADCTSAEFPHGHTVMVARSAQEAAMWNADLNLAAVRPEPVTS